MKHSFILLLVLLVSCDRPVCKNTNPIFERFPPESREYKTELATQLAAVDNTQLTYWLSDYQQVDKAGLMRVNIQGDGLCAIMALTIEKSKQGIEGIVANKGNGYIGAELQNLQFEVRRDSTRLAFIFKEVSGIVD